MTTITVNYDQEGFFGSTNLDTVDEAACREGYESQLTAALHEAFGADTEIEFNYGPTMSGVEVYDDDGNLDESATETAQDIDGKVYADGSFWTAK